MSTESDYKHFKNKLAGKTYISRRIDKENQKPIRIASKVGVIEETQHFAYEKGELIIRITPGYKFEYKATFTEDDRGISVLTIQRYDALTGTPHRLNFSFLPKEIDMLLNFITNIKLINFPDSGKINLTDEELRNLIASPNQVRRLIANNSELVAEIVRSDITTEDVVALGYRREQLMRFERLLYERDYFDSEKDQAGTTDEGLWQDFFERNTWIFGYGLSYI